MVSCPVYLRVVIGGMNALMVACVAAVTLSVSLTISFRVLDDNAKSALSQLGLETATTVNDFFARPQRQMASLVDAPQMFPLYDDHVLPTERQVDFDSRRVVRVQGHMDNGKCIPATTALDATAAAGDGAACFFHTLHESAVNCAPVSPLHNTSLVTTDVFIDPTNPSAGNYTTCFRHHSEFAATSAGIEQGASEHDSLTEYGRHMLVLLADSSFIYQRFEVSFSDGSGLLMLPLRFTDGVKRVVSFMNFPTSSTQRSKSAVSVHDTHTGHYAGADATARARVALGAAVASTNLRHPAFFSTIRGAFAGGDFSTFSPKRKVSWGVFLFIRYQTEDLMMLSLFGQFERADGTPVGYSHISLPTQKLQQLLKQGELTANTRLFLYDTKGYLVGSNSEKPVYTVSNWTGTPAANAIPSHCHLSSVATQWILSDHPDPLLACRHHVASSYDSELAEFAENEYPLMMQPFAGVHDHADDSHTGEDDHDSSSPLLKHSDGQYLYVRRLTSMPGKRSLALAMVVPEKDMIGDAAIILPLCASISAGLVLIVAAAGLAFVWYVLAPLQTIVLHMDKAARLEQDDVKVDHSMFSEISELQRAFVDLRAELSRIRAFVPQSLLNRAGTSEEDEEADMYSDDDDQSDATQSMTEGLLYGQQTTSSHVLDRHIQHTNSDVATKVGAFGIYGDAYAHQSSYTASTNSKSIASLPSGTSTGSDARQHASAAQAFQRAHPAGRAPLTPRSKQRQMSIGMASVGSESFVIPEKDGAEGLLSFAGPAGTPASAKEDGGHSSPRKNVFTVTSANHSLTSPPQTARSSSHSVGVAALSELPFSRQSEYEMKKRQSTYTTDSSVEAELEKRMRSAKKAAKQLRERTTSVGAKTGTSSQRDSTALTMTESSGGLTKSALESSTVTGTSSAARRQQQYAAQSGAVARKSNPPVGKRLKLDANVKLQSVTVLCLNLRHFHKATSMGINSTFISTIVQAITQIAQQEKGVVDSFHGDRFMISFNAVRPAANHGMRAGLVALRVAERLHSLAETGEVFKKATVTSGVATGPAQIGNLGSNDMKKFCIVGPVVTQATCLERLCKLYVGARCLVPQRLFQDLRTAAQLRTVDFVKLPFAGKPCLVADVVAEFTTDELGDDEWMYQMQYQQETAITRSPPSKALLSSKPLQTPQPPSASTRCNCDHPTPTSTKTSETNTPKASLGPTALRAVTIPAVMCSNCSGVIAGSRRVSGTSTLASMHGELTEAEITVSQECNHAWEALVMGRVHDAAKYLAKVEDLEDFLESSMDRSRRTSTGRKEIGLSNPPSIPSANGGSSTQVTRTTSSVSMHEPVSREPTRTTSCLIKPSQQSPRDLSKRGRVSVSFNVPKVVSQSEIADKDTTSRSRDNSDSPTRVPRGAEPNSRSSLPLPIDVEVTAYESDSDGKQTGTSTPALNPPAGAGLPSEVLAQSPTTALQRQATSDMPAAAVPRTSKVLSPKNALTVPVISAAADSATTGRHEYLHVSTTAMVKRLKAMILDGDAPPAPRDFGLFYDRALCD